MRSVTASRSSCSPRRKADWWRSFPRIASRPHSRHGRCGLANGPVDNRSEMPKKTAAQIEGELRPAVSRRQLGRSDSGAVLHLGICLHPSIKKHRRLGLDDRVKHHRDHLFDRRAGAAPETPVLAPSAERVRLGTVRKSTSLLNSTARADMKYVSRGKVGPRQECSASARQPRLRRKCSKREVRQAPGMPVYWRATWGEGPGGLPFRFGGCLGLPCGGGSRRAAGKKEEA